MKRFQKALASVMAVMMLVSALPATVLAEEAKPETVPADSVTETINVTNDEVSEEAPAPEETSAPEAVIDEVTYNLLCSEITVGSDEAQEGGAYVLFDENGDYTIPLEDNAFFPYEVQFAYAGDTWTEWFMDPEDTVTVGGHEFSVHSESTDPTILQQMGVWMDGEYIPAYPEEKTFAPVSLMSLLPLKKYSVTLDMSGFLEEELVNVPVSVVLHDMKSNSNGKLPQYTGNEVVVWANYSDDDYRVVNGAEGGTINLSSGDINMIVGTGDQLDPNNTRYNVDINIASVYDFFQFSCANDSDSRVGMDIIYDDEGTGEDETRWFRSICIRNNSWVDNANVYVGAAFSQEAMQKLKTSDIQVQVFSGYFDKAYQIEESAPVEITDQIWNADPTVEGRGLLYTGSNEVTFVLSRNGHVMKVIPYELDVFCESIWLNIGNVRTNDAAGTEIYGKSSTRVLQDGSMELEFTMPDEYVDGKEKYPVDDVYKLSLDVYSDRDTPRAILGVVEGWCDTVKEMKTKPTIDEVLLNGSTGYAANYAQGVTFTACTMFEEVLHFTVRFNPCNPYQEPTGPIEPPMPPDRPAPVPPQVGTDFYVYDVKSVTESGEQALESFRVTYRMDTCADEIYQTLFLLNQDQTSVQAEKVLPIFRNDTGATVYMGRNQTSAKPQESGKSKVAFKSGDMMFYTAVAERTDVTQTYGVTLLTQQEGPTLFVNGANDPYHVDKETKEPIREVYLTHENEYQHDILIANIGNQEMNGLYVRLEDAQNVALDEYWTVRENSTRKLGAFTEADSGASGHSNLAKIRLVEKKSADGTPLSGEIKGTLVVGFNDGQKKDEVRIKLVGTAGRPIITTEIIEDGVRFVPYNSMLQTNNIGNHSSGQENHYSLKFEVTGGALPDGVTLYPNGKLYGVPTQSGEFRFTVSAYYRYGGTDEVAVKEYTMIVHENSDEFVEASIDPGYEVLDKVTKHINFGSPEYPEFKDEVFRSKGAYREFYAFFLDGEELIEGRDYRSEEGSTKITILAQTFGKLHNGNHTIAAEFRTDFNDSNTVKRAAQNFTITGLPNIGGGGGGSISKPAVRPVVPQQPEMVFKDVLLSDWYGEDVKWNNENKLMIGVTHDLFKPYNLISPATVVTVLSRMDKVDLSKYDGMQDDAIPAGQWYTNAALWAKEAGLLPEGKFSAQPPIARAQFAVMLYKYLKHNGVNCTLPEVLVTFADADLMTAEENEAFQVLYQFGIFKGVGGYCMDAEGPTTRAQLAVLLHRLSVFAEEHKN